MIKVTLIGGGNLAHHLANEILNSKQLILNQIYSRSIEKISLFKEKTEITDQFEKLSSADIYIIAVSDDSIEEVALTCKNLKGLWLHTSGAKSLKVLNNHERTGVLYPLQSFTKNRNLDFSKIPLCLETKKKEDYKLLEHLAKSLSNSIYAINSDQRKQLHVAAVFVNNFVNHMYSIGSDICRNHAIPFEILEPIIKETAEKIVKISPEKAQTGPALRNDLETLKIHQQSLDANQTEIYKLLSKSIINKYKTNGN